jgi:hypothetical protein
MVLLGEKGPELIPARFGAALARRLAKTNKAADLGSLNVTKCSFFVCAGEW